MRAVHQKRTTRNAANVPVGRKILFTALTTLFFLILVYAVWLSVRSYRLYSTIILREDDWCEGFYQTHEAVGYTPKPNVTDRSYTWGNFYDVRFDRDGFRVPVNSDLNEKYYKQRPYVLALGCSFTYGDFCAAEDAYPFLVAKGIQGRALNAGVCSYGLSQMVLRAEELIPKYKPDIVLAQFSPWLIDRSMSPFAESNSIPLPKPYFYEQKNEIRIQPPLYLTDALDLRARGIDRAASGLVGYTKFTALGGMPYFFHEDRQFAWTTVRRLLGLVPSPTENRSLTIRTAYQRIYDAAEQSGSTLFIVSVGSWETAPQPDRADFPKDVTIVDAHHSLHRNLAIERQRDESYALKFKYLLEQKMPVPDPDFYLKNEGLLRKFLNNPNLKFVVEYGHWKGDPPVLFDTHPNPQAHRIIASAVVKAIKSETENKTESSRDNDN